MAIHTVRFGLRCKIDFQNPEEINYCAYVVYRAMEIKFWRKVSKENNNKEQL